MKHHTGSIEIICGSMFCGKTEELIRRLRRAVIARQHVQVFKPIIDNRYLTNKVASHNGEAFEAIPVNNAQEIRKLLNKDTTVIGIDEAQFFEPDLVDLVKEFANEGIRVIIAGLDTDFRGEPFGSMPVLMAIAERVDKFHAICMVCGESASCTQRLVNGKPAHYDDPVIIVGAAELYEARCRRHHQIPKN